MRTTDLVPLIESRSSLTCALGPNSWENRALKSAMRFVLMVARVQAGAPLSESFGRQRIETRQRHARRASQNPKTRWSPLSAARAERGRPAGDRSEVLIAPR